MGSPGHWTVGIGRALCLVGLGVEGTQLVLTWPSGWSLQSATNLPGPYFDVTNAASRYTVDMTLEPQQFFRLRQ